MKWHACTFVLNVIFAALNLLIGIGDHSAFNSVVAVICSFAAGFSFSQMEVSE